MSAGRASAARRCFVGADDPLDGEPGGRFPVRRLGVPHGLGDHQRCDDQHRALTAAGSP